MNESVYKKLFCSVPKSFLYAVIFGRQEDFMYQLSSWFAFRHNYATETSEASIRPLTFTILFSFFLVKKFLNLPGVVISNIFIIENINQHCRCSDNCCCLLSLFSLINRIKSHFNQFYVWKIWVSYLTRAIEE